MEDVGESEDLIVFSDSSVGDRADFEGLEEALGDLDMSEEAVNHSGWLKIILGGCIGCISILE